MIRNNTWSLVNLPPNKQALGCKWIFKVKENPDGTVHKHKAKLVAKDFHQVAVFDFNETFSPVVNPTTVQIILTVAIFKGWKVRQLDNINSFLNGYLKENVFMEQSPGFQSPTMVCKLYKACMV